MTAGRASVDVPEGFAGAIFDVDGVLVDSPHEWAWRKALQELMEGPWRDIRDRTTWEPEGFTTQVYGELMSGKPRMSGARAALERFGVPATEYRVEVYAARKQSAVIELIEAGQFAAYPDALRFALALRATGIRLATASSSKNAELLLRRIRLDTFAQEQGLEYDFLRPGMTLHGLMDADVSGLDIQPGKPHPEIFRVAATELGTAPRRCVVVEDAVAGILAAKAGGMAAIGVARADDAAILVDAGADLVVTSLDDVDVEGIRRGLTLARRR